MKKTPKVCVVIPAKNSDKFLRATLESLKRQSLTPQLIVVVDDGSKDETSEVAEKSGAKVIKLPDVGYYATGTPHLAEVINFGLKEGLKHNPDYIMIAGSDHIFPKSYIEEIIKRMEKTNTAIASGYVANEPWSPEVPRGGGRIIKTEYIKKIGLYPLNYGWETYCLIKARSLGLKTRVFPLPFYSQRPTSRNPTKNYYLGKGMKALGYCPEFAAARFLLLFLKNKKSAVLMLKGYLSEVRKYEDIVRYTRLIQRKKIIQYILKPHTLFNRLKSLLFTP